MASTATPTVAGQCPAISVAASVGGRATWKEWVSVLNEPPETPETCQWGYFDNSIKPVLTVKSGDIVAMECLSHHAGDAPDLMFDEGVRKIWDAFPEKERAPGGAGPEFVR